MANRGNMKMIQGTSALKIVPAREEARIIDFPVRQRHASLGAHGRKQTAGERLRARLPTRKAFWAALSSCWAALSLSLLAYFWECRHITQYMVSKILI